MEGHRRSRNCEINTKISKTRTNEVATKFQPFSNIRTQERPMSQKIWLLNGEEKKREESDLA